MTFRRTFLLLLTLAGIQGWSSPALQAQEPPDSLPPDSLPPQPAGRDSVDRSQVPDSLTQVPDSLQQLPDSVAAQDTLPLPHNLPELPEAGPAGFHTGVWEWDREALQASRAMTLAELLTEIPGVVGLRGGDYGMPGSVSAFGLAGGGIRIFWEGMELPPLEAGVADLSRIGLGGVSKVRVERRGTELRVELRSLENLDPRPYSLVEVGTGDQDTNLFRGTFSHPRALGGSVGLALDRIDTEGATGGEPGSSTGGWLRYALHRGDRAGVALEARRMTANRDTLFEPQEVARTDLAVRGRFEVTPGLVLGGFYGSSSLNGAQELEEDTAQVQINEESRSQLGLRVGLDRPWFWAEGGLTSKDGEGWPSRTVNLGGGARWEGVGGARASAEWEEWSDQGESFRTFHVQGWTAPVGGLSLFAEYGEGTRGVPFVPAVPDTVVDEGEGGDTIQGSPTVGLRSIDRSYTRYGARFERWDLRLGAARLELDVDSLGLLGLPMDEEGIWVPGGVRKGYEVSVDAPLFLGPLRFVGSYQEWDADERGRWRYFPERTWDARLSFHDTYFESRDLELLVQAGVQGRDPMTIPFESPPPEEGGEEEGGEDGEPPAEPVTLLQEVQFYQSWYLWVEVRIVTVRVFIRWENLTNKDDNFDFPGTKLPGTRALYGVRWTLWN